ncbi:conserved Plasmodium protein, unknown function [Plasmodium ovale]|uniref:Uncharacterized protein n=1 Tax=Plasmodium ovale TaxID=36330 RepID=A0A1D3U9M5_PLAOA|nr:conserved Plasmodium protein, unknown function [Plasmodium ovale]
MHFLKKRLLFSRSKCIYNLYLSSYSCNLDKGKTSNFTHLRSIYEYDDRVQENGSSIYDNARNGKGEKESLPPFAHYDNKISSKTNESFRCIFLMNSINDLKNYFENNFNEMKNYEYIYVLLKIYELVFNNFYKTYEFSETLMLDNPNFKYVSFLQYIDAYIKRGHDTIWEKDSSKVVTSNGGDNEVMFVGNVERQPSNNGIRENVQEGKIENEECTFTYKSYYGEHRSTDCDWVAEDNSASNEPSEEGIIRVNRDNSRITYGVIDRVNNVVGYAKYCNRTDSSMENSALGRNNPRNLNNCLSRIPLKRLMHIYFNYIVYLENLNVKENDWKTHLSSFLTSKYEKFYDDIMKVICKKLFSFSCKDIINILYILKRTNISHIKQISMLVENSVFQNMKFFDTEYIVRIGYIYLNNNNKKKNINNINRFSSKTFLETYINLVQNKIKCMDNKNFLKTLEYVSNNNYKHVQFFREAKREIYKRYNNFTEEQLIKLFYLYAQNISAADDFLMHHLMSSIVRMFSGGSGEVRVVVNGSCVGKAKEVEEAKEAKEAEEAEEAKEAKEVEEADNMGKERGEGYVDHCTVVPLSVLLSAIWANAKYFKDCPFLLKKSEPIILKSISHFGSSTVSMLLWAYSTVENKNGELYFDEKLYFKLKDRALEVYRFMTPKQLSNSLLGLSITIGRTVSGEGIANTDLHDEVEVYLLRSGGEAAKGGAGVTGEDRGRSHSLCGKMTSLLSLFAPEDLANVCFSYALVRSGRKEFHTMLQSALLNKASDLSPQHICKVAYTYGNFPFYSSYTLLSSLQYEILQRIHQFENNEICDILWCYCVNKFVDEKFCKYLLNVINFEKIHDPRCALLYSSLSYVNLIDPTILDSYNVLRIFNFLKNHFWNMQMLTYPHKFANDIVDVIHNENEFILSSKCNNKEDVVPIFHDVQKVYDFEGFLIDVYFEYRNEKYALFLHTALNTTLDGSPLGESILKSRYIKRKKFKTVHLLYHIWKNCGKSKINLIYSQL